MTIRQFVAQSATAMIDATRPQHRIDVVNGLARIVPVRLLDAYFGMPGPDDPTMMRWMRDIFHYIFADLTGSATVLQDALNSVAELRRWMDAHITLRKSGQGNNRSDDVLGRLLALQKSAHPWLDDNAVRRNLGGTIIGSVDTVSKFVTLAIDQLLDRPKELAEARAFAVNGDIDAVCGYAWEAVRFNPHHPLQVRFCARDALVAPGQKRAKIIPAGTDTYVGTLSAMFDPDVFTSPAKFNGRRATEYLHFGHGMHTCFGKAINGVEIPVSDPVVHSLAGSFRKGRRGGSLLCSYVDAGQKYRCDHDENESAFHDFPRTYRIGWDEPWFRWQSTPPGLPTDEQSIWQWI